MQEGQESKDQGRTDRKNLQQPVDDPWRDFRPLRHRNYLCRCLLRPNREAGEQATPRDGRVEPE